MTDRFDAHHNILAHRASNQGKLVAVIKWPAAFATVGSMLSFYLAISSGNLVWSVASALFVFGVIFFYNWNVYLKSFADHRLACYEQQCGKEDEI